jgi:AcrR family transcriptional regulator
VAHRAALNRTTAYQHFRTRDELVAAVFADLANDVARMLVAPMPIGERIDHMARFFVEHPEVTQLTLHQLISADPLPPDAWEQYLGELRRITSNSKAQPGVDVEMLGYVLMSVGILWPLLARAAHETPVAMERATERLAREVKRLLLFGVLRPEAWPDLAASIASSDELT